MKQNQIEVYDLQPALVDIKEEVLNGLLATPKSLPPKLFYDEKGSELFEHITQLPEYYLTKSEMSILEKHRQEFMHLFGSQAVLIELGSGSSEKLEIILHDQSEQLHTYMPIDISKSMLTDSANRLAQRYPSLNIVAVCADYAQLKGLPGLDPEMRKVVFYPGSTIGNMNPVEAGRFLGGVGQLLEVGDGLLIGVDLRKDVHILESAYDDQQGVTAAFNLNVLQRINRELGADFQSEQFEHKAFYNLVENRIEMHLRSKQEQQIKIAGHTISFEEGETIHTENSYKYDVRSFHHMLSTSGFDPVQVWMDDQELFSVHYATLR